MLAEASPEFMFVTVSRAMVPEAIKATEIRSSNIHYWHRILIGLFVCLIRNNINIRKES